MGKVIIFTENDMPAMANKALELLMECAKTAIAEHGHFVLVLAGGNTPKMLYSLLKDQDTDFSKWFLIYGDERCLPANHQDRNSVMVQSTWLTAVKFPAKNHYVIPAEKGAIAAAHEYSKSISHLLPADFALLGIGEDGHTASLFPQNIQRELQSNDLAIAINNSPKPPTERVSLSYQAFRQTTTVCFLASGKSKREAVRQWQKNAAQPFNLIHGRDRTLLVTDIQAI